MLNKLVGEDGGNILQVGQGRVGAVPDRGQPFGGPGGPPPLTARSLRSAAPVPLPARR
jgi:hypothetical protein